MIIESKRLFEKTTYWEWFVKKVTKKAGNEVQQKRSYSENLETVFFFCWHWWGCWNINKTTLRLFIRIYFYHKRYRLLIHFFSRVRIMRLRDSLTSLELIKVNRSKKKHYWNLGENKLAESISKKEEIVRKSWISGSCINNHINLLVDVLLAKTWKKVKVKISEQKK